MENDHDRIESILVTALEIQCEIEREKYVRQACGDDTALRSRVDELIGNHMQAGSFLDAQPQVASNLDFDEEKSGSIIGPYKLLEKLGEGGMGVVYLAEQEKPIRRQVALKVIRSGIGSSQVIARFEQERQALALMDHPNIARVLDAGVTPTGRPFLAMELVRGIPITKFCDQEALPMQDRLRLFISVCKAVQHAHQKGIIHRDLKPSNVIVGLYDGQPIAKVIDFGVAKATGQRLMEQTMFTEIGQIVGTIEYMAPEQAEMNNLDIDTRADVYSLGVLLYELLTGSPPFAARVLRQAGLGEMLRIIKEVEPTKPSTKITSADDLTRVAANRRLEPMRLARLIRGDLDWITMKCLEKTRTRRYETANDLAMDVERFLAGEEVHATPPSTSYRFRKFAVKHMRALLALATIASLLVVGTVVSIGQAIRATRAERKSNEGWAEAEQQRDEARAQRGQTREALDTILDFEGVGWLGSQERLTDVQKSFLKKAVSLYETLAVDTTTDREGRLLVAQANARVGELLCRLGQLSEASVAIEKATEQMERLAEVFCTDAEITIRLGKIYTLAGTFFENQGDNAAMERASRRAVDYHDDLAKRNPEDDSVQASLAANLRRLGLALRVSEEATDSVVAYRRAVEIQTNITRRNSIANSELTLVLYLVELGWSLQQAGRQNDARFVLEEATSRAENYVRETDVPTRNPKRLAQAYFQLLQAYLASDDWQRVELHSRRLIPMWETRAAEQPSVALYRRQLAEVHGYLGESLRQQKKWADAEIALTRSVDLLEQLETQNSSGKRNHNLQQNRSSLASTLLMQGHRGRAEDLYHMALDATKPEFRGLLEIQWAYGLALSGAIADSVASADQIDPETIRKLSLTDLGWSDYGIASTYALAAASALEESEASRITSLAIEHLQAAAKNGWSDAKYLQSDSDWDALRRRKDFLKVFEDLQTTQSKASDSAVTSK